jgi:hypothetical protein
MGYAHGRKWSDEDTKNAILKVKETMGYEHFPTKSEIISFYGNRSLTNRISKSGGTRRWANELNLPFKKCESELGNDFELLALKDIKDNAGLDGFQTKPRYPYDLVVDSDIKVDVKVSYPTVNNLGVKTNSFNLEKKNPTCDIFVLYCLNEDGSIRKTLVIPSCVLNGKTQVGVGALSKWDAFGDRWDYFKEYSEFYSSILGSAIILPQRRSKDLEW